MFTRDCDIYCDVSACAAGYKRIGWESARRETDRSVTDHAKNRPILITGRSIGASLIIIIDLIDLSKFLPELLRLWFMKSCFRHWIHFFFKLLQIFLAIANFTVHIFSPEMQHINIGIVIYIMQFWEKKSYFERKVTITFFYYLFSSEIDFLLVFR